MLRLPHFILRLYSQKGHLLFWNAITGLCEKQDLGFSLSATVNGKPDCLRHFITISKWLYYRLWKVWTELYLKGWATDERVICPVSWYLAQSQVHLYHSMHRLSRTATLLIEPYKLGISTPVYSTLTTQNKESMIYFLIK